MICPWIILLLIYYLRCNEYGARAFKQTLTKKLSIKILIVLYVITIVGFVLKRTFQ
jgi:uncharacterized membrane protein YjgN (DUF898 family)